MRDIAGQLNGFDFTKLADGVNDPVHGADVAAIFRDQWRQQIAVAANGLGILSQLQPGLATAVLATELDGGAERVSAIFPLLGNLGGLGDPSDDFAVPPQAAFGFGFSIDTLVGLAQGFWSQLTAAGGRVSSDTFASDADGDIQLNQLELLVAEASNELVTLVSGEKIVGHRLPNASFTFAIAERIDPSVSVGDFTLLRYAHELDVSVDRGDLDAAIQEIEAGVSIFGALFPFGTFGASGIGGAVSWLNRLVAGSVPALPDLRPLQLMARCFPTRVLLPGTKDRLTFRYDRVTFPEGMARSDVPAGHSLLARFTLTDSILPAKGSAVVVSGTELPRRVPRSGYVIISGPSQVVFEPGNNNAVTRFYTAIPNDELVEPISYTWRALDKNNHPATMAKLSTTTEQTIPVTFFHPGPTATPEPVTLHVDIDDALHLRDPNNRLISATRRVSTSVASPPRPPPRGIGGRTGPVRVR